eukprot:scaffold325395_cov38-Prasinocladus_malaysianus.AAC.1
MTAHAYANAGLCSEQLLTALMSEARPKLEGFTPQGLSLMAWAMSRCQRYDGVLFDQLASAARRKLTRFEPVHVAN